MKLDNKQKLTSDYFRELRDRIRDNFVKIEYDYLNSDKKNNDIIITENPKFDIDIWHKINKDDGGGEKSIMRGNIFEKIGVNISNIYGKFDEVFRGKIPATDKSLNFWAAGISLVAHMRSPLVPAIHMNVRFINIDNRKWFGGGIDLNPIFEDKEDVKFFHNKLKKICDKNNPNYYDKFKKECDDYFYIKHRNVSRGAGGIFYDYLDNDFDKDFIFTKDVGNVFLEIFPSLVYKNMFKKWNNDQREEQLRKRGYYTEFNLLYDRGTKFGLATQEANIEAILMSLPPIAKW